MKWLIKFLNRSALILGLTLLTGCLPWPHTTERSDPASGRVLDANTHKPIADAKIEFNQPPHHTTYTDANGYFYLKATRNFHWAYTEGGGWPDNKDNAMKISHPNYATVWGVWRTNTGDILLQPKK
jgi:hypothetical protein